MHNLKTQADLSPCQGCVKIRHYWRRHTSKQILGSCGSIARQPRTGEWESADFYLVIGIEYCNKTVSFNTVSLYL